MRRCVCEMGKGVPRELLAFISERCTARPNNVAGFRAVCPVGVGFELWPRGLNCGGWTRRTGEKPPSLTRPARGRRYKDGRPIARLSTRRRSTSRTHGRPNNRRSRGARMAPRTPRRPPRSRAYRRGCRPKPRTSRTLRGRLSKCRQCGPVGTRSRGRRVGGCVGACSIVGDAPIKDFRLKVLLHSPSGTSTR